VEVPPVEPAEGPLVPDALAERLQRLVPKELAERLLATRGQVQAERRIVTILFSDVTGSTAMAEELDPEDVMEIMDGAFDVLIEPIYRYEGTLARLMGDAILAFFGAPIAHEDDPERAIRAALDIIDGAKHYAAKLERERGIEGFDVRVGINTGLVVVGEIGSDLRVEYTAMGDAINLAARMEGAADPGTVLITEDTHKLIASLFETEALGPIEVKGKAEPVSVYRVLGAKAVGGKVRGIAGLASPLVGREAEFEALQEAIERLRAGVGSIVTLVGEAGIGKSRLVAGLRKENLAKVCEPDGSREPSQGLAAPQWIEGRCLSYGTFIAYLLWLDVLRSLLNMSVEDPLIAVRDALRQLVQTLCPDYLDDVYPYLCRLMSLPLEDEVKAVLRDLEGEQLKVGTFRAVEILIEYAAGDRPLVLVCEDLHWADPTSIELLEHLLALTDRAPLLFICVFRPQTEHGSWGLRETAARLYHHRYTDLWLDPLSASESETLVGNLLRVEALPQELRGRILSHAEGNPFYVEEIIRSLMDSGAIVRDEATGRWQATQEVADIAIPDTLHGVLMARIDRLQEETKWVLQLASVIGRIFLYRVLAAIAQEERELDAHLLTLQREEMIRERARLPELEYIFKHHLTQEAAYNGLLKKDRHILHCQVAETLEQLYPDRMEEQVELLAHHWERAEKPEKAISYLLRAGRKAVRLYANETAIAHLTRGLKLLRTLPETPERDQRELDFLVALGVPLVLTKGHAAPEVEMTYTQARELSRQVGETPQLFQVLHGLRRYYFGRGELQAAHELGEQLLTLARSVQHTTHLSRAHVMHAEILYYLGEFAQAREHCEQGLALCNPQQRRSYVFLYGNDTEVLGIVLEGLALWHLGYPDQAVKRAREGLTLAQELSHPFTLAVALYYTAALHQLRRDVQKVQERIETLLRISAERRFALFLAWGTALRGWALAEQGGIEEGIVQMQRGLAAWRTTGGEVWLPIPLSFLAEAYGKVGKAEEGLALLTEGLGLVDKNGERCREAELHRLKGELLLKQSEGETCSRDAETCFRQALEVAHRQSAKSWELRAAMSLSRLWQRQGKREEAGKLLQEISGWFTEGFDTPDLKEAKALLEESS
jgi:class 3 adenylate cyclase/predicted ATPase